MTSRSPVARDSERLLGRRSRRRAAAPRRAVHDRRRAAGLRWRRGAGDGAGLEPDDAVRHPPHLPARRRTMSRSEGVRRTAATAIAGGVIGLVLTPPMASIWAYDPPSTPWASMHWVERTFGPTLESWGALSFGWSGHGPYEVYGKGFFLVYAAMAPIVRLVHQRYEHREAPADGSSGPGGSCGRHSWCAPSRTSPATGASRCRGHSAKPCGAADSMEMVASHCSCVDDGVRRDFSAPPHCPGVGFTLARGSNPACRRHVGNRGRLHPERVCRTTQCHLGRIRRDASRPIKESTSAVRGTDCLLVRR